MLVNLFLAKGVAGLLHLSIGIKKQLIGSFLSGIYISLCITTSNVILCSWPVYIATTIMNALLYFGISKSARAGAVAFTLLYLALGGVCISRQAVASLLIGSLGIGVICILVSVGRCQKYIRVRFRYHFRDYELCALLDTGNMLKDPVSGQPVLIVAADVAQQLTGLSTDQLRSPIDSIGLVSGARLIPYKTIGQSSVFLLGISVDFVDIDGWRGSGTVALSPELFGSKGTFQALTGGYI